MGEEAVGRQIAVSMTLWRPCAESPPLSNMIGSLARRALAASPDLSRLGRTWSRAHTLWMFRSTAEEGVDAMGVPPARAQPSVGESATDDNAAGGTPLWGWGCPLRGSVPDPAFLDGQAPLNVVGSGTP